MVRSIEKEVRSRPDRRAKIQIQIQIQIRSFLVSRFVILVPLSHKSRNEFPAKNVTFDGRHTDKSCLLIRAKYSGLSFPSLGTISRDLGWLDSQIRDAKFHI